MTASSATQISVFDTLDALAGEFLQEFVRLGQEAIAARGQFSVALTGGRSARQIYERLAAPANGAGEAAGLDWKGVKIFWGDERTVPPNSPDSNYKLAYDAWLTRGAIPAENIHRWQTEAADKLLEAERYAAVIRREVPANAALRSGIPAFDLVLLGMGDDAHIASLLPGTPALEEKTDLTAWNSVPQLGAKRFTFTLPLINAAREVWLLVTGEAKAPLVGELVELEHHGEERLHLPASRVRPAAGKLRWWLDKAAAAEVEHHASV